jgi:hypothetical protein
MMQLQYDNHGPYEIVGLAPGRYTLITNPSRTEGQPAQAREIDVDANGEIEKNPAATYVPVSAKVQYEGTPAGQTSLQLLNRKSRAPAANQAVGDDGTLTFAQGIAPGSYEVSLYSRSGAYVKTLTATGAKVAGRTVDIRAGSEVKLAITAANGQGSITGSAVRESKPVGAAMIVLVPADSAHNQVLFRRDQTNTDGSFTLPNVVPGAYTLLAIERGWELEWTNPEVLKNYMSGGVPVSVQANGKYDLKVPVQ